MRALTMIVVGGLMLASFQIAAAHGGGKAQLTRAAAGPYLVFAWTSPEPWRVGNTHTTIAVTTPLDNGQETPVTGAQVEVTYTPVSAPAQAVRVAAVEQQAGSVGFYEADADLSSAGQWQVAVAVSGPEGGGAATFSEQVLPGESFNWWWIGGGVLVVLALVGFWGTRRSQPARGRPAGGAARSKA